MSLQRRTSENGAGELESASLVPHGAPRTRQRLHKPPPTLDVPDIDEDAAERKRVLNVLAQRRYRERKRQAKKAGKSGDGSSRQNSGVEAEATEGPENPRTLVAGPDTPPPNGHVFHLDQVGPESNDPNFNLSAADGVVDTGIDDAWPAGSVSPSSFSSMMLASVPMNDFFGNPLGEPEPSDAATSLSTLSLSTLPITRTTVSPAALLEDSSSSASTGSPPDSYLLPVNELSFLRALFRIAERINCDQNMWDLSSESPFFRGVATPANQLPKAWRPTASQLLVSHHPFIDFLPWPAVREKIIAILGMDDSMKPPTAVGPLGMVNFAYDVEDSAEGVRIWGGDVYDPSSWEVGQVLFERWWFLFDREIIENSNRWRRLRGAPPLRLNRPGMGT